MNYQGSCHCNQVRFEVEGTLDSILECNCSHCDVKAIQWWFVPRSQFKLISGEDLLKTYTFNKHAIQHQFCTQCGTQPFSFGEDPKGPVASINVRCLKNVDVSALEKHTYDGLNS